MVTKQWIASKKRKLKKKKDFQNWKNFLQAHESTPFSNSFFSIVPHMQFEGMRDMYNLYSIPNLNKSNIGLLRGQSFVKLEVNTGSSKSSNIWILTAACLHLRTCTMRAITFSYTQITLHTYVCTYAFWATVAYFMWLSYTGCAIQKW